MRSTGRAMPQESPIMREAEFAGRNSGLETVASNLAVCNAGWFLQGG